MKYLLWILLAALLISNIAWTTQYSRLNERRKYADDLACAQEQLIELREMFSPSTPFHLVKEKLSQMNYEILDLGIIEKYNPKEYEGKHLISVMPIKECAQSQRPYCGFDFFFQKDKLFKINDSYPCH